MEGVDVLVSWKIDADKDRCILDGQYSFVHAITILNQPWTLSISSVNPKPEHLLLKLPSSNEVKLTANLEMSYNSNRRETETPTKRFVKILEANETEVALPIRNKCAKYNDYNYGEHPIQIYGYLNISEISSGSIDGKLQGKAIVQLSKDFCYLLKEQDSVFTDVNLKCRDVVIPAHRTILSARSPVFAAMFRNRMKETLDGTVCVEDIDPEIFKIMLSHLYGGVTGKLTTETAGQLLFAADKYQLEGLKEICSDCLKTNLCLKNALEILVLGDLHDGSLKSDVLNFICKSSEFSQLESSEEWKTIQCEKPQLAIEVLTTLVKYLYAIKK